MANEHKIIEILEFELGVNAAEINLDTSLAEDLDCDSLDVAELVMVFEHSFAVSISDAAAESLRTVRDIVELIDSLTA